LNDINATEDQIMTPIINRSTALLLVGLAFSGHLLAEDAGAPVSDQASDP
jgi:hypothetical protein